MNYRPSLPTVGNPRTWLVSRFRIAAEGIGDEVIDPPAPEETGAAQPDDSPPDERKGLRINVARWVAAATLAIVLSGAGYEGWLLFQHHQKGVASAQALDAAKKYILALTSVDTNAIDRNFAEVLDGSTGEFKDMYTKSSAQLRQTLIDNKAAAHGSVVDAAVQSATEDRVDVVLFVDQSVSNGAAPAPQVDRSRVKMTMEKVDGRWLASKVELP